MMTISELKKATEQIRQWLEWDTQAINLFHAYAQRFRCTPGANVYKFVLQDALRSHGLTLEQFVEITKEEK